MNEQQEALSRHEAANHPPDECTCFDHLPKDLKVWCVVGPEGDRYYLDDATRAADEVEHDYRAADALTKRLEAMQPGDKHDCGSGFDIECLMVNQQWFDTLPEFEGW